MSSGRNRDWALWYAGNGFRVLPCSLDKSPLLTNGCTGASADPRAIRGWWRKWPSASIGLATGSANGFSWFVVDFDTESKKPVDLVGMDAVKQFARYIVPTWGTRTGSGGTHLWYLAPADRCPRNKQYLKVDGKSCSIDVRGEGGYIVAPPSDHESGTPYRWARESRYTCPTMAMASDDMLNLVCWVEPVLVSQPGPLPAIYGDGDRVARAAEYWARELAMAGKGNRHNTLFRACLFFGNRKHEFSMAQVRSLLLPMWASVAPDDPGYFERALRDGWAKARG